LKPYGTNKTCHNGDIGMKKFLNLLIFGAVVLSMAACTAQQTPNTPTGASNSTNESQPGLSTLNTLAVGIFKLDGTANDVTADQAKELVVLWKAFDQVRNSDTSSPEEKDALIKQIQSTLTAEQNTAINNLGLTAQDVSKLMQEKGISAKAETTTKSSSSSSTGRGFSGGPGGFPGGGMPGGGPDGGGMPGGTSATPAAGGTGNRPQMGAMVTENMTQAIIKALIKMLETKIV
jgi:hypothetical protein